MTKSFISKYLWLCRKNFPRSLSASGEGKEVQHLLSTSLLEAMSLVQPHHPHCMEQPCGVVPPSTSTQERRASSRREVPTAPAPREGVRVSCTTRPWGASAIPNLFPGSVCSHGKQHLPVWEKKRWECRQRDKRNSISEDSPCPASCILLPHVTQVSMCFLSHEVLLLPPRQNCPPQCLPQALLDAGRRVDREDLGASGSQPCFLSAQGERCHPFLML